MVLDIVLGIIVLINLLLGLKRGLLVMVGRLLLLVLILAVTLTIAGPLTSLLSESSALRPLADKTGEYVLGPLVDSAANIGSAIDSLGLPEILSDLLLSKLPTPDNPVAANLPQISEVLFKYVLSAIVFILMLIILVVVIKLLTKWLTGLADSLPHVGGANHFGGMLLGLVIGLVQMSVILLILGFLAPVFDFAANWLQDSWVASWFFEIDVLSIIF